jgi:hypothetical protein
MKSKDSGFAPQPGQPFTIKKLSAVAFSVLPDFFRLHLALVAVLVDGLLRAVKPLGQSGQATNDLGWMRGPGKQLHHQFNGRPGVNVMIFKYFLPKLAIFVSGDLDHAAK